MNEEPRPSSIGERTLDKSWDAYVDHAGSLTSDPLIQMLHQQRIPRPAPSFVEHLRQQIVQAANESPGSAAKGLNPESDDGRMNQVRTISVDQPRTFVPPSSASGVSRWASIALVAAILLAVVGGSWYANRTNPSNGPTSIPAASIQDATPEAPAQFADMPMPGADAARTSNQPGPGLESIPEIAATGNTTGNSMVLVDDNLVVLSSGDLKSIDAHSLEENWSVDIVEGGYFGHVAVADGRIFFSSALGTEQGISEGGLGELLAYSLDDGTLLWRMPDIGIGPSSPIPVGDIVYSVGAADGEYVVGAYRATDGSEVWSIRTGRYTWCCPGAGMAMADGVLVASLVGDLVAFSVESGEILWTARPGGRAIFGLPVIGDGFVAVPSSDEQYTDVFIPTENGLVQAFDLRTGEVVWENISARNFASPLSVADGILYAGLWGDEAIGTVALISPTDGQTVWSIDLPHVAGDGQVYVGTSYGVPTVVVGDTAYLVTSTVRSGGGNTQASLLTAVDLATGEIEWMTQLTGGVSSAPIVVGGNVFLLTSDFGMIALQGGGTPFEVPGQAIDLRTMQVCTAPVADSPMMEQLPDAPSIPGVADWKQPITFSEIPTGQPLPAETSETVQQLNAMFEHYRACSEADPYRKVFRFFSTDFYIRLQSVQAYWGEPEQPWAVWMAPMLEYLYLDPLSVDQLPDGRIGGIVSSSQQNFYVWFVEEDGVWKIDEYHRIVADPATIEASPAATPA